MIDHKAIIKINLLPPELKKRARGEFFDRTLIYMVFMLILLVVLLVFVNHSQVNQISELNNQIRITEAEIKRYQPQIEAVNEARRMKEVIQKRIDAIQKLEVERPLWVNTMQEFANVLTDNLWYNNIKYSAGTSVVELDGHCYSLSDIAQFLINLRSSDFFTGISLRSISKRTQREGQYDTYQYSIRMTLVKDILKGELGEFVVTTPRDEEDRRPAYREVDLTPRGPEALGQEREKAREAIHEMAR